MAWTTQGRADDPSALLSSLSRREQPLGAVAWCIAPTPVIPPQRNLGTVPSFVNVHPGHPSLTQSATSRAGDGLLGLRIAVVGPVPPPAGGMANQTRQLAELLRGSGAEVCVVACTCT
jgi:hypothetical protein